MESDHIKRIDALHPIARKSVVTLAEEYLGKSRLSRMLSGCASMLCATVLFAQNHAAWRDYGGHSDAAQYSALLCQRRS